MLTMRRVRKRYGRRPVIESVDLDVPAGTTVVVSGGNGSGKSTLLRIAAGASMPSGGTVRRPESVGYVPERQPATIRMDAREYLRHMGRIRGLAATTVRDRGDALLADLGLVPGPDTPFSALSKGNRQKLLLAQALLGEPALLVLDEPFSGLDDPARERCVAHLNAAASAGAAVLVSAPDAATVPDALHSHRMHVLVEGRIRAAEHPAPAALHALLVATGPDADRDALAGRAGVRSVDPVGDAVAVVTEDADGLLRYALTHGWSLRAARM